MSLPRGTETSRRKGVIPFSASRLHVFAPGGGGHPPDEARRQLHVQGLSTVVCQPCRGLVRFDLPILFPPRLIALPLALSPLLPAAAQQPDRRPARRTAAAGSSSPLPLAQSSRMRRRVAPFVTGGIWCRRDGGAVRGSRPIQRSARRGAYDSSMSTQSPSRNW